MNKIEQLNLRGNTRVSYYISQSDYTYYIVGLTNNDSDEEYFLMGRKTSSWFEYEGLENPLDDFDPRANNVNNVSPFTWEILFSEEAIT